MKEFTVIGSLTLEGVVFCVKAETLEDALSKFDVGDYDGHDIDLSYIVAHSMDLTSIEENG